MDVQRLARFSRLAGASSFSDRHDNWNKSKLNPEVARVWNHWYLDEEKEIFRQDPWAYGLEKNSRVISKFLSYCYELGVSEKKMSPKDLFRPSTWDLVDS